MLYTNLAEIDRSQKESTQMATKAIAEKIELTRKEIEFLLLEYIYSINWPATIRFTGNQLPNNNHQLGISLIRFNLADIRIYFNKKGVTITNEEIDEHLKLLFADLEKANKVKVSVWEYIPGEPDILEYNMSLGFCFPELNYGEKRALLERLQLPTEDQKTKKKVKPSGIRVGM